jgi:hypothetical protein
MECGLRALVLLTASSPVGCDLQRLTFFDYLLVHSGDVPGGPASIHPATPLRSGEALVRRHWIEHGLRLMLSRELIEPGFSPNGITYQSTTLSAPFLGYLEQQYTRLLRERAAWVIAEFGPYTDAALVTFFQTHLDRWGGEFIFEGLNEDEL